MIRLKSFRDSFLHVVRQVDPGLAHLKEAELRAREYAGMSVAAPLGMQSRLALILAVITLTLLLGLGGLIGPNFASWLMQRSGASSTSLALPDPQSLREIRT